MHLKSLELTGFKSFAKKGSLEFTSSITAIVGPNGSGKSNVAESFRFVLGEQSLKSLRGKKGEDMIFNGSAEVPRANKAGVKIVFDNKKRLLNIDFDEVSLERAVYRDGVNEYFINGSKVRLKDIVELLAGAHIGPSGHHIISQGEADRILNANIKERKVMVEDALGLKIYQYKREESEKKLEKTEENIKQVESLRREIAPHIRFLKKQVEKVEKARALREELQNLYREYLKREYEFIEAERVRISTERKEPEKKASDLEKELAEAKQILLSSAKKDEKSEEIVSIEEDLQKVRKEKENLSREIGRLEGEIASQERMLQRLVSVDTSHGTIPFKEVESFTGSIENELSSAESTEDLSVVKKTLSNIRDILKKFITEKKGSHNADLRKEYEVEISNLKKHKEELEEKTGQFLEKEKELMGRHSSLQSDIEKEKDSNRDAEKAVFRIMADQNNVNVTLKELAVAEARLKLIDEEFKREVAEGASLVGHALLQYKEFQIVGADFLNEARNLQEDRKRQIEKIKIRLEEAGGGSAEEIMKEYNEVSERDVFLAKELEDLEKSSASLRVLITELQEKLDTQFKEGVEKINTQFQEFFALMFGGGSAKLSVIKEKKRRRGALESALEDGESEGLVTEEEETEEGIDIDVSLPRKKTKGLMMLSGGERALTSIALLFAVSQVNPPPFIILDETDAALDEANSKKYGDMVASLSKHSQLILITHNRETMSRAGVIYGVTMGGGGVSRLLSIAFEEAQVVAK